MSNSSAEVVDIGPPVDARLVDGEGHDHRLLDVVLVLDLADDLLEQVLDRHEAGRAAVLVEHDRDVDLAALELVQEVVDGQSTRARTRACAAPSGTAAVPAHRT